MHVSHTHTHTVTPSSFLYTPASMPEGVLLSHSLQTDERKMKTERKRYIDILSITVQDLEPI